MNERQRIELLERAVLAYIEKYGFLDEARNYFIKSFKSAVCGEAEKP